MKIPRVGRTARGEGGKGHALMILRPEELGFLRSFIKCGQLTLLANLPGIWNRPMSLSTSLSSHGRRCPTFNPSLRNWFPRTTSSTSLPRRRTRWQRRRNWHHYIYPDNPSGLCEGLWESLPETDLWCSIALPESCWPEFRVNIIHQDVIPWAETWISCQVCGSPPHWHWRCC